MAWTKGRDSLRIWMSPPAQIVASIGGDISDSAFAAGGRVLVVVMAKDNRRNHEIRFYDLAQSRPGTAKCSRRRVSQGAAVSPDGGLVVTSNHWRSVTAV